MTPSQVLTVAALGGLAALLGLILFIAASLGLVAGITRLVDAHEAHRQRRRTLADYRRELDALPTTNHPKEKRR